MKLGVHFPFFIFHLQWKIKMTVCTRTEELGMICNTKKTKFMILNPTDKTEVLRMRYLNPQLIYCNFYILPFWLEIAYSRPFFRGLGA